MTGLAQIAAAVVLPKSYRLTTITALIDFLLMISAAMAFARYAWSSRIDAAGTRRPSDYHNVLLKRLKALDARLHDQFHEQYGAFESRAYVDTGPVVERSLAVAATAIIHRRVVIRGSRMAEVSATIRLLPPAPVLVLRTGGLQMLCERGQSDLGPPSIHVGLILDRVGDELPPFAVELGPIDLLLLLVRQDAVGEIGDVSGFHVAPRGRSHQGQASLLEG